MLQNLKNTTYLLVIIIILMVMAFGAGWYITKGQAERWKENFRAERDSIFTEMRNDQMLYHAQTVSLSRLEFRHFYENEYQALKKLGLKQPQQLTNIQTITTHHVNTLLKDSTVRDTVKVRVMDYHNANMSIQAVIDADTLTLTYQHRLSLDVVLSKKKRTGFFNKILLRPLKRPLMVTAIPDDKNTVIVKLKTLVIK